MTEGTETITTINFVWMGLLALLVVIGIVAGMRMKRRRVEAQREVEAHAEEAGVEMAPLSDDAAPSPPPVTPAPPPIADAPLAGTPPAADVASGEESLTRIKGLGPKVAARLEELGITRVEQLAALDDVQAASLDADLGPFAGRLSRDRWVEQARLLAAGDRDGFERVFGRL